MTDDKCAPKWNESNNTYAVDKIRHSTASTLTECQKACEFDPGCVAVDWLSTYNWCWINTNASHTHVEGSVKGPTPPPNTTVRPFYITHHDLVSRCNVLSGRCFDSIMFFCGIVHSAHTTVCFP